MTHAVKSALPVAAREVSSEILDDHTAPLWPIHARRCQVVKTLLICYLGNLKAVNHAPRNDPTQSPNQFLSIGFPSLQAEMR